MSETRRGKATEIEEQILARPISDEERARRNPQLPRLRLAEDVPATNVDNASPVAQVLADLDDEPSGAVVARRRDGSLAAVVVTIDRYLALVGKELSVSGRKQATLHGDIAPSNEALAAAHVEQIDPAERWTAPSQII
jgi:hypothetical protein